MESFGIHVSDEVLAHYADAAQRIAGLDLVPVEASASRDEAAMRVAVGSHTFSRLLMRFVAVAQAARAREVLVTGGAV